jgi:hypothetical protein
MTCATATPPQVKIDWKALSQRIGHADVAFAMKQYVQTDLEADRQAANTLAALIIGGTLARRLEREPPRQAAVPCLACVPGRRPGGLKRYPRIRTVGAPPRNNLPGRSPTGRRVKAQQSLVRCSERRLALS